VQIPFNLESEVALQHHLLLFGDTRY
jgi:hypothetical protein